MCSTRNANQGTRKAQKKMRHQVRLSSATTSETPVDDGFSWRKYSQKEILGAKHPRVYYRCTLRDAQGCSATKQVQRANEDPALFEIIYHGEHTCVQRPATSGMNHYDNEWRVWCELEESGSTFVEGNLGDNQWLVQSEPNELMSTLDNVEEIFDMAGHRELLRVIRARRSLRHR
ncbi:unnamed protein product [Urochloa humidicola]